MQRSRRKARAPRRRDRGFFFLVPVRDTHLHRYISAKGKARSLSLSRREQRRMTRETACSEITQFTVECRWLVPSTARFLVASHCCEPLLRAVAASRCCELCAVPLLKAIVSFARGAIYIVKRARALAPTSGS